jgi:hypothetical protein
MEQTKNSKILWIICRIIEALILVVAGVLAIIYYDNKDFYNIIFIIVGAFTICDALLLGTRYFIEPLDPITRGKGLGLASGELAVGIVLCIVLCIKPSLLPDVISQVFVLFLGVYLIAMAVILVVQGFIKIYTKFKPVLAIIADFLLAAICVALGVLVIYYYSSDVFFKVVFIIIGVFLVLTGILVAASSFRPVDHKDDKDTENTEAGSDKAEENVVEANSTDVAEDVDAPIDESK